MLFPMLSDAWLPLLALCCISWIMWLVGFGRCGVHRRLPPGPMGLPVVGMLPFLGPQLHTYFAGLIHTYGPLVSLRLGMKTAVIVGSPKLAKQVLRDFDVSFANRHVTAATRELMYGGSDISFGSYGPEWRMLRKVCVSGMLGAAPLDASYNLRRQSMQQTITYLNQHVGRPIDIGEQMYLMALDSIASTLWGATLTEEARTTLVGEDFRRVISTSVDLLGAPNVSDFFPGLAWFDLQGVVKTARDSVKKLDGMIEAVLEQRKEKGNVEGKDFLQVLLQLKDDEGDARTPLTMSQIKALLIDLILAGTDSTHGTVEFAMAEMINNPQVMRKAQQELEAVIGVGNQVEEAHISRLPYLKAIMEETLRLHPPLPLLIPRCARETRVIGGYTIPKGSIVFINIWAIQRDATLWDDPLEFKPERFMGGQQDVNGSDFTCLPFGYGRRICIGKALAERMIMVCLASFLHYFDWELPKGDEESDFSEKLGFSLKKSKPLFLIPSSRS